MRCSCAIGSSRASSRRSCSPIAKHRRWLTTFIVVGGGFSGVETAGELVDFLYASLRYYPRIQRDDIRIVLLHSGDRLLPELSASLGRVHGPQDAHARHRCAAQRARRARDRSRLCTLAIGEIIAGGHRRLHDRHAAESVARSDSRDRRIAGASGREPGFVRARMSKASGRRAIAPPCRTRSTARSRLRPRNSPRQGASARGNIVAKLAGRADARVLGIARRDSSPRSATTRPWPRSSASGCRGSSPG